MPLYEYRCKDCGAVFEILVGQNSKEKTICEKCGGAKVKKLPSSPAVHVKTGRPAPPSCGKEARCCGREQACDVPPCGRK